MRRTVSGISILSVKFRRRIRYICTCSRSIVVSASRSVARRNATGYSRRSSTEGRWSPGRQSRRDPPTMSMKERTNVFPDAAKSFGEPSCNVSTSILRRRVWRIRDLFARSYVFMKSTIAIDMYNMYPMYDHRTGLAENWRSNAGAKVVLETVNARGCTNCQERIAFMWGKKTREIVTKKRR